MVLNTLIPLFSAILGGLLVHFLTIYRDRTNKRRDQRIGYLIEAYRCLESCANRNSGFDLTKIEPAIADIQLFGSSTQVKLVQEFIFEFERKKNGSLDGLLENLRTDLRNELRLPSVDKKIFHLRILSSKNKSS